MFLLRITFNLPLEKMPMRKEIIIQLSFVLLLFFCVLSCREVHNPKPRGYFRIVFPEKEYSRFDSNCNFTFDYPSYAIIVPDNEADAEPCWLNVVFPEFRAKIHLSYKEIKSRDALYSLIEDSREMVYKHTVKADAIKETLIIQPEHVYGLLYDLEGNSASVIQFFLTDSLNHYLRGALYFHVKSNRDSLDPVIDFIRDDISHLLKSFHWKNNRRD
jgi:gliding motility-associated lipoprotein GldD